MSMSKVKYVEGDNLTYTFPGSDEAILHHSRGTCRGDVCPFHAPTNHSMRDFPMLWRGDRGLLERTCSHGCGHPDPDDLAAKKVILGDRYDDYAFDVHGCCGCCA